MLQRRTFLRGLGTVMALPLLEAMSPLAADTASPSGSLPRRMAFVYVPNGANMVDWTPRNLGANYDLPKILKPLASVQSELCVLSGLTHDKARAHGDGGGDHARASSVFLTGCQPRKTSGADIHVGVSVDQLVAQKAGHATPFPSLELGCDHGQSSGNCDSGYSCAYSFNIAWRTPSAPVPPETNPRQAFERLFSNGDPTESTEAHARRLAYRKSVLDLVLDDARTLNRQLGRTDQRKLDEYLSSVRELERRIDFSERMSTEVAGGKPPANTPSDYQEHLRLMYDVLALAFRTDSTRVATYIHAHDGSNRAYPFIGISDGHHDLSHHQDDAEKKAKIAQINLFHTTQFAYFVQKLKSTPEGAGTLLDNCMIVYGSGLADGNAHNHDNLPVLLAGRGGGTITPGRHVRYAKETPMTNLYLSMMERMGVEVPRLGDSTGRLDRLSV